MITPAQWRKVEELLCREGGCTRADIIRKCRMRPGSVTGPAIGQHFGVRLVEIHLPGGIKRYSMPERPPTMDDIIAIMIAPDQEF